MSASERLAALNAATPLEKYEIDLFSVLPEIVAVVREAERDHPYDAESGCPMCVALAALEKKLEER